MAKRNEPRREPCDLRVPSSTRCKEEMVRSCLTKTQRRNLYEQIRPLFDRDTRRRLGLQVPCALYPQDPWTAERIPALGLEEVFVDWEPGLADGPTSARFAVVDYDADRDQLADVSRWDETAWTFLDAAGNPVAANPDSPEFRQVHLWATARSILDFYQDPWVLGRPVPWAFEGNRLILVPHAGWGENAFYDRRSKSLQLYYYGPQEERRYTCLSHDVIAHEIGHAILDGIRPLYHEHSSLETAAFHEFVADLTALLTCVRANVARDVTAHWDDLKSREEDNGKYPEDLKDFTGHLAPEFGAYCSGRPYLRSALNRHDLAHALRATTPHDCSELLTATVYELHERLAAQFLERDAANTVPQALWWAADRIRRLALQPLDYLPPVDVRFLDYARAMLRCHELTSPGASAGYRELILEIFHRRGFCSCEVWAEQHERGECVLDPPRLPRGLLHHDLDRLAGSRTGAYAFLHDNRGALGIPAHRDFFVADLYRIHKWDVGRERLPEEIVIEYVWREAVELEGDRFGELEGERVDLLCGGTLVLDGRGNAVSWLAKPGTGSEEGERRIEELRDHVAAEVARGALGLVEPDEEAQLGLLAPPVVARRQGDALRLESTPNLRDRSSEGGGAATLDSETRGRRPFDLGGERWTTSF